MSFEGQNNDMVQQMQAMLSMAQSGMPPPDLNDPNMAQAMMMFQYLTAQQAMGAGGGLGGAGMGLPPMPFPGMNTPYTPSVPTEPTVAVSVEGMKFQYQLTEDDLHKVFSRYGGVKTIRVDEIGAGAQITFVNHNDAQSAMQDLNGKVLNGLEGTLRLSWVSQGSQAALAPPYPSMPFPGMGGFPGFPGAGPAGWPPAAGGSAPGGGGPAIQGRQEHSMGLQGSHTKGVRKYTCRFIIGIQNDKDFQVARRVIGAKGANMKRIVKQTEAKLRLRGEGSGYFEGSGQQESSEPLQLCVSCTNGEQYKDAVRQVEDLLKRVYEEYRAFCRDNGMMVPDLQINFSENQLVYSAARSSPGGGGGGADDIDGDNSLSPGQEQRRSRRSRAKGSAKSPGGDDDRGEPGPNAPPTDEIEKQIDARPCSAFEQGGMARACGRGHRLCFTRICPGERGCDVCGQEITAPYAYHCGLCDYDLCAECHLPVEAQKEERQRLEGLAQKEAEARLAQKEAEAEEAAKQKMEEAKKAEVEQAATIVAPGDCKVMVSFNDRTAGHEAEQLTKFLTSRGIPTFCTRVYCPSGACSDWQKSTNKGIKTANTLVLLITDGWLLSEPCQEETQTFTQLKKRTQFAHKKVVPVNFPGINMEHYLEDDSVLFNFLNIQQITQADSDWMEQVWKRVC